MTTKATIDAYFASLKQKKGWESFLADDMVFTSFTSPIKQISGSAAYLESTKRFYSGVIAFEVRDLLVDGEKACALTRYQLQRPGVPAFESNVAEVFRVRDGKITSFDIYFGSAPFPKRTTNLAGSRANRKSASECPDWAGLLVRPPNPPLEQAFRRFKEIQVAKGGNPYLGRALKGLLQESGFSQILVTFRMRYLMILPCLWGGLLVGLDLRGHTELRRDAPELRIWCENPDALVDDILV